MNIATKLKEIYMPKHANCIEKSKKDAYIIL